MHRFSPKTVIELIRAFDFRTHAHLEQVALEYGLIEAVGRGDIGVQKKEINLMKYLSDSPALMGPAGSPLILEMIEHVVRHRCRTWAGVQDPGTVLPELVNALKQDGFIISDYQVRPMLPEAVPVAAAQDELVRLLNKHGLRTALGHLEQSLAAHARSDWAAANAQLRTFFEELFDQIAHRLGAGHGAPLPTSHDRRQWLATRTPPFLDPDLNEWGQNGTGFIPGLWKRLHPQGSHPGLSDEEDSTFRLHIVLITAQHYLNRFDRGVG